jgi:hypothetical protein
VLAHAEYATIEVSESALDVTLCRVALDRSALREAVLGSDLPLRGPLIGAYSA